jgi:hypothetical protein
MSKREKYNFKAIAFLVITFIFCIFISCSVPDSDPRLIDQSQLQSPDIENLGNYRNSRLVSADRIGNIRLYTDNTIPYEWVVAIDEAVALWNSIPNCAVNFSRVQSGAYDINFRYYDYGEPRSYSRTTWPSTDGKPGSYIKINSNLLESARPTLTPYGKMTIMAHELGHTIGFHHANEDGPTSGIHIPGTPTAAFATSIMSDQVDIQARYLTTYDIIAAQQIYPADIPRIVFYENADYGGRRLTVLQGDSFFDLAAGGFDNVISSVKIFGGVKCWIFENSNYGGRTLQVVNNISRLSSNNFNDIVSSIKFSEKKIALKASLNKRYVCADFYDNTDAATWNPNAPLYSNRDEVNEWEAFDLIDFGNGNGALRSRATGKFVCAENAGASRAVANRDYIQDWEIFGLSTMMGDDIFFKAQANGKYLRSDSFKTEELNRGPGTAFILINLQ